MGANNNRTSVQPFYCMSQASNKKLCEEFSDGMALGDNHMEEIDEVLRRYSDGNVHNLFSTDKVYPKPKDYHRFTRVFAGEDTPPIDESYIVCTEIPNHAVYYKFVPSREYNQYPALSTGFHNSSFHVIRIQDSFIQMIKSALGNTGSYARRCTNIHQGHLSFVGPRKVGRMNQPTVQEGPKERSFLYL